MISLDEVGMKIEQQSKLFKKLNGLLILGNL